MPPHLQLTLLNVPPALDATASLPRPQVLLGAHYLKPCIPAYFAPCLPGVKYIWQNFRCLRCSVRCNTLICSPVVKLCRLGSPACASSPGVASRSQTLWHAADAVHCECSMSS